MPAGGSQLPGPSFARTQFAGAEKRADATVGRGIAAVGDTIQKIGHQMQVVSDNAEFKNKTIDFETSLNAELARVKKNNLDPDAYKAEATKVTNKLFTEYKGKVGLRNKQRFGTVLKQYQSRTDKEITRETFGKVIDKSKAVHIKLEESVVNDVITGKLTQEQGLGIVNQSLNEMASSGVIGAVDEETGSLAFTSRLAEAKFEADFTSDPIAAVDDLMNNKTMSIERKNNLIDKETRKINHVASINKEQKRLNRISRQKGLMDIARKGEDSIEDVLKQDKIDNPNNPISADAENVIINRFYKTIGEGGTGNPEATDIIRQKIKKNPKQFTIDDIYAYEAQEDLNTPESKEIEALWEKRVSGRVDPNDPTTFREVRNAIEKVTDTFTPSPYDVSAQLGIKKLRLTEAESFAESVAREEFKKTKDIDATVSAVRMKTLKHMQEYDDIIQKAIDEGRLELGESSALGIEDLVTSEFEKRSRFKEVGKHISQVTYGVDDIDNKIVEEFTEEDIDKVTVLYDRFDNGLITEEELDRQLKIINGGELE